MALSHPLEAIPDFVNAATMRSPHVKRLRIPLPARLRRWAWRGPNGNTFAVNCGDDSVANTSLQQTTELSDYALSSPLAIRIDPLKKWVVSQNAPQQCPQGRDVNWQSVPNGLRISIALLRRIDFMVCSLHNLPLDAALEQFLHGFCKRLLASPSLDRLKGYTTTNRPVDR